MVWGEIRLNEDLNVFIKDLIYIIVIIYYYFYLNVFFKIWLFN